MKATSAGYHDFKVKDRIDLLGDESPRCPWWGQSYTVPPPKKKYNKTVKPNAKCEFWYLTASSTTLLDCVVLDAVGAGCHRFFCQQNGWQPILLAEQHHLLARHRCCRRLKTYFLDKILFFPSSAGRKKRSILAASTGKKAYCKHIVLVCSAPGQLVRFWVFFCWLHFRFRKPHR